LATDAELDAYLVSVRHADKPNNRPSSDEKTVRSLFEEKAGTWSLKQGETDTVECKQNFRIKPHDHFSEALRAVAALANNKGGYVFFGVKNKPTEVTGLSDDRFTNTDTAQISTVVSTALDPVPEFSVNAVEFDGKRVGVICVQAHSNRPVIATKTVGSDFIEGAIYFRYPAQSKLVKPGELRQILAIREAAAVHAFAEKMQRIAIGRSASLDLDTGIVSGRAGHFSIDAKLLDKIKFIHEGEFNEVSGAPALRVIGDVSPQRVGESSNVVHRHLSDSDVLQTFLRRHKVKSGLPYILHAAHSGRLWLPIFYYADQSKEDLKTILQLLKDEHATHPQSRDAVISRLTGEQSAYQKVGGKAKELRDRLLKGRIDNPTNENEATRVAWAIMGLDGWKRSFSELTGLLQSCYLLVSKSSSKSVVYRSACRVDEMIAAIKPAKKNK